MKSTNDRYFLILEEEIVGYGGCIGTQDNPSSLSIPFVFEDQRVPQNVDFCISYIPPAV
jgi:hypothetical protein